MSSNELKTRWLSGDALEAGVALVNGIPMLERPAWAARCLRVAITRLDAAAPGPIRHCVQVVEAPSEWTYAHDAFSRIRALVLSREGASAAAEAPATLDWVLAVGELTAKIAYNATLPSDPFDEDSGSWLVKCMRGLAEHEADPAFEDEVWECVAAVVPPPA